MRADVEVRFPVSAKLKRSSRRWRHLALGAGCLLLMGAGFTVYGGGSEMLTAGLVIYGILCLLASWRLRWYSRALAAGRFDLVLSGDTLRVSRRELRRDSIVGVTSQSLVFDRPVRLILRTARPRRRYIVDLRRFRGGEKIPEAIDLWMTEAQSPG